MKQIENRVEREEEERAQSKQETGEGKVTRRRRGRERMECIFPSVFSPANTLSCMLRSACAPMRMWITTTYPSCDAKWSAVLPSCTEITALNTDAINQLNASTHTTVCELIFPFPMSCCTALASPESAALWSGVHSSYQVESQL